MKLPRVRITVRRMMVAVAIAGGLLALAVAFEHEWRPDLHHLIVSRQVVITGPDLVDQSGAAVRAGSPAVVVTDEWDATGSISGSRAVVVTTFDGKSVQVRRDDLRPIREDPGNEGLLERIPNVDVPGRQ
jgi:hypothetical protein